MGATDPAAALEIAVDLAAIRAAHARIRPHVHRTPVLTSRSLDAAAGLLKQLKAMREIVG